MIERSKKKDDDAMRVNTSPLFELARVLVRFDHIVSAASLVGQWSLPAQEIPAELLRPNALRSDALRNYSKNSGVFPVRIVPWGTEVAVGRNDNFAHPRYTSFSPGIAS
jgi:hypothetical protein